MENKNLQKVVEFFEEHPEIAKQFKKEKGVEIDKVIDDFKKNWIYCPVTEIDINKDVEWKESNKGLSLSDEYDLYSYMDCKMGSNVSWWSLDRVGEYDTVLIISDADASMSRIKLIESPVKKAERTKGGN